jgi:hypothetical protein
MNTRSVIAVLLAALWASGCFAGKLLFTDQRSFRDTTKRTQQIRSGEEFKVLQGECVVTITYNDDGTMKDFKVANPDGDTKKCSADNVASPPLPPGLTLKENSGSLTFVHGTGPHTQAADSSSGKMICYGPPIPSPPKCVCVSGPC